MPLFNTMFPVPGQSIIFSITCIDQSSDWPYFFAFKCYYWGSMRPLNYPWISHLAPKPIASLISKIKAILFWCKVCILIHWQHSIMRPIISSAFRFFWSSVIPFKEFLSIQKLPEFAYRAACFYKASFKGKEGTWSWFEFSPLLTF